MRRKIFVPVIIVVLLVFGYLVMVQIIDSGKVKMTATVQGWSGQAANLGEVIDLGFWDLKLDPGDVFGPSGSPHFADQPFTLIEAFKDNSARVKIDNSLMLASGEQAGVGGTFLISSEKTCFRNVDSDIGVDLCLKMVEK